jgi:hypothetical protein
MNQFENILRQTRASLNRLGIHPLALLLGAVLCLFFPRLFILAALGYGAWWTAKNIWHDPRKRGSRGGRGRR